MTRVRHMRPRVVLVHGSVANGPATWSGQTALGDLFELVILNRPGFPPNHAVARVDFDEHAEWLAQLLLEQDHVVGHSYGGVVSLLAAAARPELVRSLTVIEPPATRVALDNPVVAQFAADGSDWWTQGPKDDPEAFLRGFLRTVGSAYDPPSPLPPDIEQGARALVAERGPWEAEIPLETLSSAPFPKLVVSGDHHAAFEGICDTLERELHAERVVLPGHGHSVQRHPQFNSVLADFVERARLHPDRHA